MACCSAEYAGIQALLESARPGDGLSVWLPNGAAPVFLSEAAHIPAGPRPYHSGSVLDHTARCMNAVAGDPLAVWMALTHDAGKLTTPKSLWPHHYGHEYRGNILAGIWARQLALDDLFYSAGRACALSHMRAGRYALLRPGKKYRLLQTLMTAPYAEAFWKVVDADTRTQSSRLARAHWRLINSEENAAKPEHDKIALLKNA